MSIIDFEIEEIKKICENVVEKSKIIACQPPPTALLRVDIESSVQLHCKITVCLRFPDQYPKQPILVELKSRHLPDHFLNGLTRLCEQKAAQHFDKPQCLIVLQFVQQYLKENSLCVCISEILQLRRDLEIAAADASDCSSSSTSSSPLDQLKLKQRTSSLILNTKNGSYFYRVQALVPNDYPQRCIDLQSPESNLPPVLIRFLNGQSREYARQCVEPPLSLLARKTASPFEPVPSLYRSMSFLIETMREFHNELCPICDKIILSRDPNDLQLDDTKDDYIERVYCGHLYHQCCLKRYLQEPPFTKGGKLCPAKTIKILNKNSSLNSNINNYNNNNNKSATAKELNNKCANAAAGVTNCVGGAMVRGGKIPTCGVRLAHDRWVLDVKVAESRWAQKQARERELEEVVDFLK